MCRLWTAWWFLAFSLGCVPEALAQTRFFTNGDSGLTLTWEAVPHNLNADGYDSRFDLVYTHKGLFDLGVAYQPADPGQNYGESRNWFFGKLAVIRPQAAAGWGLELGASVSKQVHEFNTPYFPTPTTEKRYRSYETALGAFRRWQRSPRSGLILGLNGLYRWHHSQTVTSTGEPLFVREYGEYGLALDTQWRFAGSWALALRLEYAEDRYWAVDGDWGVAVIFSISKMFGRDTGD